VIVTTQFCIVMFAVLDATEQKISMYSFVASETCWVVEQAP